MEQNLQQLKSVVFPILKQAGITQSSFFGSVARGQSRDDSDVDIVIEFEDQKTLFDLVELQQALEKAVGRKVDLITRRSLHPPLADIIRKEEIQIF